MAQDTRERLTEATFPSKGLDVRFPYTEQPQGTTAEGINCRVYDPLLMRSRGGSRSGLTRYVDDSVGGLIQDLNTVPYVNEIAVGSVNYFAGGTDITTLPFSGTYILGKTNL